MIPGPILESKGIYATHKKKCNESTKNVEKEQKRAKYLKIWAKMYKISEYFEKGQLTMCDY